MHCLIKVCYDNSVVVTGDFNAHPESRFGNELVGFRHEYGYVTSDVEVLEEESTRVSNATGRTRWLDHVVCPITLMGNITNVHVNHCVIGSDHSPLCFTLGNAMVSLSVLESDARIKYMVKNNRQYYMNTESMRKCINLPTNVQTCNNRTYHDASHMRDMMNALLESGYSSRLSCSCVPYRGEANRVMVLCTGIRHGLNYFNHTEIVQKAEGRDCK